MVGSGSLQRRWRKSGPNAPLLVGVSKVGLQSGFQKCLIELAFV